MDFVIKQELFSKRALKAKVGTEIDRLEVEYAQNLEEEVSSLKSDLVEKSRFLPFLRC